MPEMTSSEVCASSITAHLAKLLYLAFGLDLKTVEAWRRPKASDIAPTGTGKANPLDQVERAIRVIHPFDRAGARRWAQYVTSVCDELDREQAATGFESAEQRMKKVAQLMRESTEAAIALMQNDDDEAALREVEEAIEAGKEVADYLRAEIGSKVH